MEIKERELSRIEGMLETREARVLSWSLVARLSFFGIFAFLDILYFFGLIVPGIAAENDADATAVLIILGLAMVLISYGLIKVRQKKHLFKPGLGAVILDLILIAIIPVMWLKTIQVPDGSPAHRVIEQHGGNYRYSANWAAEPLLLSFCR